MAGCPVLFLHSDGQEARASSGVRPGGGAEEGQREGAHSFQNEKEASKAIALLRQVLAANPDLTSIAILTPYNGQVCGGCTTQEGRPEGKYVCLHGCSWGQAARDARG